MNAALRDDFVATTASYFPESYADDLSGPISSSGLSGRKAALAGVAFIAVSSLASFSPAFAAETRPAGVRTGVLSYSDAQRVNPQLKAAKARLDKLCTKQEGWKGPGSVPMSISTRQSAEQFLACYFAAGTMIEPFIGLDSDGDITLFWKTDKVVMDLSITSDGTYSFFADVKGAKPLMADDAQVSSPLPESLLEPLRVSAA